MIVPLIQVNLTINVLWNLDLFTVVQKKALWFFYRDVTAFHEIPLTPHCFPSRNITKNAETHPPHMRDVIIEQPHICFYKFL